METNQTRPIGVGETPADWYRQVIGQWWGNADRREKLLAEAHVRERAARPEDVEAVAEVIWVPYRNSFGCKTDFSWSAVPADAAWSMDVRRIRACAQAIITRYGPPPSPPQITDTDVERCAEAVWPWIRSTLTVSDKMTWSQVQPGSGAHDITTDAARAALTAFLNPPPPDPIQAALDRAAKQVREAGGVWTDVHAAAVRAVLGERKDG